MSLCLGGVREGLMMPFPALSPDWSPSHHPWLISYERYQIRPTITMPADDTSLIDIFEQSCANFAKQTAYICHHQTLTYQQLDRLSLKIATFLQQSGIKQGDKVGVMMPNLLHYPVLILAILRAGMVLVNINPLHTAPELNHQLNDANVTTLFVLDKFLPTLEKLSHSPVKQLVVCYASDFSHRLVASAHRVVTHVKNQFFSKKSPDFQRYYFNQILTAHFTKPYQRPNLTLADVALLQYTGGTTGIPKGAMLTHGNLIANILQMDTLVTSAFDDDNLSTQQQADIVLTALPLYHVFAFTICGLYVMYRGFSGLLIPNPRKLAEIVSQWQRHPIGFFVGVNTLFNGILQQPNFHQLDFSGLKASIGGGMAISPQVAETWHAVTGTPIVEGYGLSETSPVVAFNPLTIAHFTQKIGIPAPSTDIQLIDEQGKAVKLGERGEIVVKGLQVMKGYHNHPDNSEAFTSNGYLRTGDIGMMDGQGFIKIVGRTKDMIAVSGFNVYPSEIETVINAHPDVIECGAIGVPSDVRGEDPKIFVVSRNPNLTEQALIDYGKAHLAGYKRPRIVEFVKELPKSPVGKVLRKELRKMQGLE